MLKDVQIKGPLLRLRRRLRAARRPHALLLVPLLVLGGGMIGGQAGLFLMAILCPALLAVAWPTEADWNGWGRDPLTGLILPEGVEEYLDGAIAQATRRGKVTGALVIEIDGFARLETGHDRRTVDQVLQVCALRLIDVLREQDMAGRIGGARFVVGLSPVRRLDLEATIQLASRIQQVLAAPIRSDGINLYVTASVGFALSNRLAQPGGAEILRAATLALAEALRNGPTAIRSYSDAMRSRVLERASLVEQVTTALETGQIAPFFQPQIHARSGDVTGVEALARWLHPERGLIPPIEFLPAVEQAGQMDSLCEVMVRQSLRALAHWDQRGLAVPQIGVNFSSAELRDPRLIERIRWELECNGLAPERLAIEVLETVVADRRDDIVLQNLCALADLGCRLDLDDFGTGHASITSIRRYAIQRIKIDRSFVTRIDQDEEQQKMVEAILTMAERLGLDTLAEGVETAKEEAILADLGCTHLQGFGIARPMTQADADRWLHERRATRGGAILMNRRAV